MEPFFTLSRDMPFPTLCTSLYSFVAAGMFWSMGKSQGVCEMTATELKEYKVICRSG